MSSISDCCLSKAEVSQIFLDFTFFNCFYNGTELKNKLFQKSPKKEKLKSIVQLLSSKTDNSMILNKKLSSEHVLITSDTDNNLLEIPKNIKEKTKAKNINTGPEILNIFKNVVEDN
jgi:hypothetical protein